MSAFDSLKKNRSKSLEKLTEQLSKIGNKGYSNPDEHTYWKPSRDSAGNGFAIIRFLPAIQDEDIPFVKYWDHGFEGPGGWYIENSLSSIGQDDPVGELNRKLYNASKDENSPERKQAAKQKRRLHYVSNIYIIKDSGNPENEGKVFRFKYGKKIWDKVNGSMNPSFEYETPVNPFDLWEGANFRLKIKQVEGYSNYDASTFDSPSALFEDDDKMEVVYNQCYSLKEILDPKNYKSYDELKTKLHKVLGLIDEGAVAQRASAKKTADEDIDEALDMSKEVAKQPKSKDEPVIPASDDDDDGLEFFKSLAKG